MPDMREQLLKGARSLRWLVPYAWQKIASRRRAAPPLHLVIAVADHFEPAILPEAPGTFAGEDAQSRRLERWCREYPRALGRFLDADGFPFRHTYFYPAEQFSESIVGRLAEHCASGWGEVEVHLHHGVDRPDNAAATQRALTEFRDALARMRCLSRWDGEGTARYAFVHGNWALANSAGGRFCGVDDEMQVLADTGCYGDFTLPAAPSPAQIGKINAVYECALPLDRSAPHRRGRDLKRGRTPGVFPLIVQGPLALEVPRRGRWLPRIENGELTSVRPPTLQRLSLWRQAAIGVIGRPDWLFIKLHCHGMDPRDEAAMYGPPMRRFLQEVIEHSRSEGDILHFVTAREMVNILLAACDGRDGNPGEYRDYRLRLIHPPDRAKAA